MGEDESEENLWRTFESRVSQAIAEGMFAKPTHGHSLCLHILLNGGEAVPPKALESLQAIRDSFGGKDVAELSKWDRSIVGEKLVALLRFTTRRGRDA